MVLIGSDNRAPRHPAPRRFSLLWLVPFVVVALVAAVAGVALATSGSSGSSRTSSATKATTHEAKGSPTAATATRAPAKHGSTTTTVPPPPPPPPPTDIQPLVSPPLPGEGHWAPAGRQATWAPGGTPAGTTPVVYTTTLRPPGGGEPTGLAWINTQLTKTVLYAGSGGEPAGTWPAQGSIDPSVRPQLVAAFNSGFRLSTGAGGWYTAGKAAVPLQSGLASLVINADGSATVGMWGRDVSLTPDVVSVRQNLHLLVDGGQPVNLSSDWGATLGGGSNVWRSALGVNAQGDLIYAAGPSLDASELAHVLVAAGCVRAMELDINPEWVTFSSYAQALFAPPDQVQGTPLLSTMNYGPSHWLEPSDRDFFAVFTR